MTDLAAPPGDLEATLMLSAWSRWDEFPADRGRAVDMELACVPLARRVGVTVTEFRRRLAAERQCRVKEHPYFDPRDVLAEVLG